METYKLLNLVKVEESVVSNETRLSICLEANGFSFSLISDRTLKLLSLGRFECGLSGSIPQVMNRIRECFASIGIFMFKFANVRVVCQSSRNVWVPYKLYDSRNNRDYLNGVTHLYESETVIANVVEKLDAVSVFAYPMHTYSGIKILMPNAFYCCQHQVMAEYAYDISSFSKNTFLMYKRRQACDFVVFKGNTFQISNSYEYKQASDLVYYILFAMDKLGIDTGEVQLLLTGDGYADDELNLLRKYVRDVSYANPMENIKVGCEFDGLDLQSYFLVLA